MGRIAKMLSFMRVTRNNAKISDVKVDPGGVPLITVENFQPIGDDSHPIPGDYVALNTDTGTGRETAIAYLDPINVPKALKGEKRTYSRDSSGFSIAEIWLKSDGEITVNNPNGFITLLANGDVNINNAIIDTAGNITSPGTVTAPNLVGTASVTAATKELAGHIHPAGTPPGNTGANI